MNLKRSAISAFLVASAFKAILIIVWRLFRPPLLGALLTKCDPAAAFLAERTTSLFFDQKRLFPSSGEGLFFEIALTISFGIECMVVALAIRWLVRRSHGASHGSEVRAR